MFFSGHVEVTGTIAVLETMLSTKFHHATHYRHRQTATLAEAVTLPASITEAVSTVFGLHGLPLPPKNTPVRASTPPDVTPDTITKDYKITGVKASGDLKNRQGTAQPVLLLVVTNYCQQPSLSSRDSS